MNQKVLLLGSTGMLGHQVFFKLKEEGFEVVDVVYRNKLRDESIILDLNNSEVLKELIKNERPDYIVNCVGILIKGANDNPANAIYINAYLPHFLAKEADEINAKLIHVSTDCVFSGDRGQYTETDEKDGKDVYAKTKALGEVEGSRHLTLRTSIIGPELKNNGEGLFHWFMQQEGETKGFTRAMWSGVTTTELAKVIVQAISQDLSGLYHVTNNEPINKYELLKLFREFTDKDIVINPIDGKEIDKTILDTRKELKKEIPSYSVMIKEMVDYIQCRKELYSNYKQLHEVCVSN